MSPHQGHADSSLWSKLTPPNHAVTPECTTQPLPLCPKELRGAQLPLPQHPQHPHRHQPALMGLHMSTTGCGPTLGCYYPLPIPSSSWASTGCELWGQCCCHQFFSEAFQFGAEAWKGSACCIRQLQPCKGQGCFGKELFAEASPSPRSLLSAQAPAPTALPVLTHSHPAHPLGMEKLHIRTLLLTVSTRGP